MKRIIVLLLSLVLLIQLAACSDKDEASSSGAVSQTDTPKAEMIISENEYYKIFSSDYMYAYCIYNSKGEEVKRVESSTAMPIITQTDDNLLRVTTQGGTGIGTQSGYYYDIENDIFSKTFRCIFDEHNGKVLHCVSYDTVAVSDIFGDAYYYEITGFSKPFADSAFPIVDAEFISDGKEVKITYMTGEDYEETTDVFKIK
ncbi:MAG: hypothetical protein J6L81_02105 [Clostridia bacterium]|nr:hypothetical protein [Clostridia bacterium]